MHVHYFSPCSSLKLKLLDTNRGGQMKVRIADDMGVRGFLEKQVSTSFSTEKIFNTTFNRHEAYQPNIGLANDVICYKILFSQTRHSMTVS